MATLARRLESMGQESLWTWGGLALALFGLTRRSWTGLALTAAGGAAMYRARSGRFSLASLRATPLATAPVRVERSITVQKPREEVYRAWRDFPRLPVFMKHLESVELLSGARSRWRARGPAHHSVEWIAEIVEDRSGELFRWATVADSEILHQGQVAFEDAPASRGTVVHVSLQYDAPGGKLGVWIARVFGEEPSQQIGDDLRRFKQWMEAGEIATVEQQPRGERSLLGKALNPTH